MDKGDIQEVIGENGQVLYAAARITVGQVRGTRSITTVKTTKKLTQGEASGITSAIKSLKWEFTVSIKDQAEEDKNQTLNDKTKSKLSEAVAVMNSTAREAEKTLPATAGLTSDAAAKVVKQLKLTLKDLYKWIQLINEQNMGLSEPWKCSADIKKDLELAATCVIECQDNLKAVKALTK